MIHSALHPINSSAMIFRKHCLFSPYCRYSQPLFLPANVANPYYLRVMYVCSPSQAVNTYTLTSLFPYVEVMVAGFPGSSTHGVGERHELDPTKLRDDSCRWWKRELTE